MGCVSESKLRDVIGKVSELSRVEIILAVTMKISAVKVWLFTPSFIYRFMQKSRDARIINWNQQREQLPLRRFIHLYINMFIIYRYIQSAERAVYDTKSFIDIL